MRTFTHCLAASLLVILVAFSGPALAADPAAQKSGTAAGDTWTLSVSAGTKYLMPQDYKGADTITNNPGVHVGDTDTDYSRGFFGAAVSLAGDYKTTLAIPGFKEVHLVSAFSYAGGSDHRSRTQSAGAGNYFVATSIDPAATWLGGIGVAGDTASTRVSVAMDNFDLSLGLEGRAEAWTFGNGARMTPVLGVGILASTQRYKVSTRITSQANGDRDSLVETIRTYEVGPELRAGLSTVFSGGMSLSAVANAALLAGWADLYASQSLTTVGSWTPSQRLPVPYATRSQYDSYLSGLFGLTLRAEYPVADSMKLGLEGSGRYWTSRPTVKNPIALSGSVISAATEHNGVRIGHDSAAELGAALTFSYSF